jgi:hypothetical protein
MLKFVLLCQIYHIQIYLMLLIYILLCTAAAAFFFPKKKLDMNMIHLGQPHGLLNSTILLSSIASNAAGLLH